MTSYGIAWPTPWKDGGLTGRDSFVANQDLLATMADALTGNGKRPVLRCDFDTRETPEARDVAFEAAIRVGLDLVVIIALGERKQKFPKCWRGKVPAASINEVATLAARLDARRPRPRLVEVGNEPSGLDVSTFIRYVKAVQQQYHGSVGVSVGEKANFASGHFDFGDRVHAACPETVSVLHPYRDDPFAVIPDYAELKQRFGRLAVTEFNQPLTAVLGEASQALAIKREINAAREHVELFIAYSHHSGLADDPWALWINGEPRPTVAVLSEAT